MKKLNTIFYFRIVLAFVIFSFISCSKDSDEPEIVEISVTTSDFSIKMDENPANGQVIGTVQGRSNNGTVTFSITEQNPVGAFSIDSASGELKVANETLFDFEANPTITGIVKVANGLIFKTALVTITLNDANENNIFDGNVMLSTQAEVDEFGTHNYTGITGHLIIGYNFGYDYSNITNLLPLEDLTFVGNEIVISNNGELQNLIGLQNLSEIGSSLSIYENPVLNTIESLNGLTIIHENLSLYWNASLTTLNGLHNITVVEQNLTVQGMPIVTLKGLHNLITLRGSINLSFNPLLENIDNLSISGRVFGSINITNNSALGNLDGLQNSFGSANVVRIIDNESLLNLNGLNNIGPVQNLFITNNSSLTNLLGLEKITKIEDHGDIRNNENLISLNGLENLMEVRQFLTIQRNSNLLDFCSLTNLCVSGTIETLSISNNAYNPTKQDIIDGNCSL